MTDALIHRGPNDAGHYTDRNVSLGHRRLSIIDLSKKGHQPMSNKKNTIHLIFNGEIWNFKELRAQLIQKGYIFKSDSDTEVIVQGYEEYGEEICSMLDGMFAFALWDKKKKKLLLARDRMGKKPLYYYHSAEKLVFASEIKSILQDAEIPRKLNEHCLSDYLTLRYSPGNSTMFEGIWKLPPASYAVFQSGVLTIRRYYALPNFTATHRAEKEKGSLLISRAIEKRLIADVPLGIFLSGGLDSSAIVAYASRFLKKIKTFSVSFDSAVDESHYARIVARNFKTQHTEIKVEKDLLKYLPEVVYHFDEPLADPAALPTYALCKEVSKHVTVALSGEGGDEVFGGYDSFNYLPQLRFLYSFPHLLRKGIISPFFSLLSRFYPYPRKHMFLAFSHIVRHSTIEQGFRELFYFPFDYQEKNLLFAKSVTDPFPVPRQKFDITAQRYYFNEWLPNDLLMKADKMGMIHHIEIRTPFLDRELVEYFASLSYEEKHNRKLFRQIVSPLLPSAIMKKKKQGFTLPLYDWFSDADTFKRIVPFLEKLKQRHIFNVAYIDTLMKNPVIFKNEHKLWVLLNFELWYEIYLDRVDYRKIKI